MGGRTKFWKYANSPAQKISSDAMGENVSIMTGGVMDAQTALTLRTKGGVTHANQDQPYVPARTDAFRTLLHVMGTLTVRTERTRGTAVPVMDEVSTARRTISVFLFDCKTKILFNKFLILGIPYSWRCDGERDCQTDGADESKCVCLFGLCFNRLL